MEDGKVLCTHCGKVLNAMRSAKRHFAITHQENEPLKCNICQATCKNRPALNKHVNRLHKMSIKDAESLASASTTVQLKREPEEDIEALVEATLETE